MNKQMDMSDSVVEFFTPISVSESAISLTNKDSIMEISGTAINAGITRNNIRYTSEELMNCAGTLKGKPLMKNHSNKVEDIVGRVREGAYADDKVSYKAFVADKEMQKKIKNKLITDVSIRAKYDTMEEDEDNEGVMIVHKLDIVELSLVAVPGDPNTSINQDFNCVIEAYDNKLEEACESVVEGLIKEEFEMEEKTKEEPIKEEPKEEEGPKEEPKKEMKEEPVEEPKEEPKEEKIEEPKEEKESHDAELSELKKKVKELEEELAQGKGGVVKEEEEVIEEDYVSEYVCGEGDVFYKRGVL